MTKPQRHTRGLQLGFLALLVFSTAQVVWWVYDQTHLARRERENLERLYDTEVQLAGRLLAEGRRWQEISSLLPDLALEGGRVVPSSAALAAIETSTPGACAATAPRGASSCSCSSPAWQ